MKQILEISRQKQIKDSFFRHNIHTVFCDDKKDVHDYLSAHLKENSKIAVGGSVTLNELDIIKFLRQPQYLFIDRYLEGLTREDMHEKFREAFESDYFITSSNAITVDGCLYNIDGTGNRVAAMIYGPKEVIVIVGINKIFDSKEEALHHIKNVSAPKNALRLNKKTPCAVTGQCINCLSLDRICSSYVELSYQSSKNRITILIVNETLGY